MGKGKRTRKKRASNIRVSTVSSLPLNARGSALKLAHAQDHLHEVKALVEAWVDACLKTLREDPDPDAPGYFCAWIDAAEINAHDLSLLIGDCLQAFRSALDHLAFELACAFTSPMTQEIEQDSSFPILSDLDKAGYGRGLHKWVSAQPKIRGIDPVAQTVIEGLQPYKRGQAYDTDPLWILSELNNVDKHRVLHVVQRAMDGAGMPVNGPNLPRDMWSTNVRFMGLASGEPFTITTGGEIATEGRTQVARWPMLPIDPKAPMHMNFRPVLDITFHPDTPLVAETTVLEVLREIHDHIVGNVFPPLATFLK